jgi:hypothetical protein
MIDPTQPAPTPEMSDEQIVPANNTARNKLIRQAATACKNYRKKLIKNWDTSVSYRKGLPYSTQSDEDRIAVNLDWSFTKMKQASLFSQVPAVRVNHPPHTTSKEVMPWLHAYEQRINDQLVQGGIETTMEEALPDCINASGLGIAMVGHEAITEMVDVPAIDLASLPPALHQQIMQSGMMPNGTPVPMESVPKVLDKRYCISRVSPSDFLWPLSFTGSNFDDASWIGRTGQIQWATAQRRWKLDPALKEKYVGTTKQTEDRINQDTERDVDAAQEEYVMFDEIFYKEEAYDPDVRQFDAIHHLIFLNGQEKPVVDEPWKGQEFDEEAGQLIGALRYPIRVLSLSYITDEAIPPSDSAIARPQVDELNKSRTQMMLQRQHSLPIRTFDVNRIDPAVQYNLMRGAWQGMIPVQGNGSTIIAEVSRSAFPQENFTFDAVIKADASLAWQVGQEPLGNDIETKGEANIVQTNFQTRIGRERAKVGAFFCSIAEVLGGLISLYEDPSSFGEGFTPAISRTLAYSILADSTVLLDSNQRLKKINEFVNMWAKSGWVAVEEVAKEAASLSGLDPAVVIRPPQPAPPAEPNISLRFSGAEDMMNPLMLAFLIKSGQAPDSQTIEQAKHLIEGAMVAPPQQIPQLGPDGQLMPPGPSPADSTPNPPPPAVGDANPNWSAMSKINQRIVDREHD